MKSPPGGRGRLWSLDAGPATTSWTRPYLGHVNDDVFLVLIFPDGVTRTLGDKPIDVLRAKAREWQRLQPGTIAELRRGNTTIEVLGSKPSP